MDKIQEETKIAYAELLLEHYDMEFIEELALLQILADLDKADEKELFDEIQHYCPWLIE